MTEAGLWHCLDDPTRPPTLTPALRITLLASPGRVSTRPRRCSSSGRVGDSHVRLVSRGITHADTCLPWEEGIRKICLARRSSNRRRTFGGLPSAVSTGAAPLTLYCLLLSSKLLLRSISVHPLHHQECCRGLTRPRAPSPSPPHTHSKHVHLLSLVERLGVLSALGRLPSRNPSGTSQACEIPILFYFTAFCLLPESRLALGPLAIAAAVSCS